MEDANLDLALRAVLFGAVGTAGQRCTTTRRLILAAGDRRPVHRAARAGLRSGAHRRPARAVDADGPADRRRAVETMMKAWPRSREQRRRGRLRRKSARRAAGTLRRADDRAHPAAMPRSSRTRRSRRSCTSTSSTTPGRGDRDPERRAAGSVVGDLHDEPDARPRSSCPTAGATAASPTSTSAPRAPRSAARSAARRRRAAGASRAPTPGSPTCAARPTRSTGARICRSPRA